jgi:hypothetical protein
VFLKIVNPLTSSAYPAEMSLFITTDAEPVPKLVIGAVILNAVTGEIFTLPELATIPVNDASITDLV